MVVVSLPEAKEWETRCNTLIINSHMATEEVAVVRERTIWATM